MTEHENIAQALELLRNTAAGIRRLEAAAAKALHDEGDTVAHRDLMLEKCDLLADMPESVEELLEDAGPDAQRLLRGLEGFARRANQALDLESIFYMSALLYPEEYTDGDPNDLERFLATFQA